MEVYFRPLRRTNFDEFAVHTDVPFETPPKRDAESAKRIFFALTHQYRHQHRYATTLHRSFVAPHPRCRTSRRSSRRHRIVAPPARETSGAGVGVWTGVHSLRSMEARGFGVNKSSGTTFPFSELNSENEKALKLNEHMRSNNHRDTLSHEHEFSLLKVCFGSLG
jgi:hypothetical protein